MNERLDEEGIKSLLSNEIRSSLTYDDTELSSKRSRALEYYRGEMSDTPSLPNRSSVVSRDVADTIGWMLTGIIRVFTASDQMALYEPEKPGDEPFAKQATDYINNLFFKENEGYRILWDGTHDSLLLGNGIIKHWWDSSEEIKVTEHSGVTEEQIALLQSDPEVEIAAQKQGEPQFMAVPDQAGGMVEVPIPTYDVKLKSGNFVPSKQKAGSFADALELMDMLAEANGLKKKNNAKEPERRTPPPPTTEKKLPTAYTKNLAVGSK